MMISSAMNARINDQITVELAAAHLYLAIACHLDRMGLKMLKKFFLKQSEEERRHAMKFINYLQDVGGAVTLQAVPQPRSQFSNVQAIAQAALDAELDNTAKINELVALAQSEKDYATNSFLKWFVDEQVEEVRTMTDLLNVVKLAGNNLLQVESYLRHLMLVEEGS